MGGGSQGPLCTSEGNLPLAGLRDSGEAPVCVLSVWGGGLFLDQELLSFLA